MANTKSALKAWRQNIKRRARNRPARRAVRTVIGKAVAATAPAQPVDAAEAAIRLAIRSLDKAAEKKIIHRNNAARRKSRLMKRLNTLKAAAAS